MCARRRHASLFPYLYRRFAVFCDQLGDYLEGILQVVLDYMEKAFQPAPGASILAAIEAGFQAVLYMSDPRFVACRVLLRMDTRVESESLFLKGGVTFSML